MNVSQSYREGVLLRRQFWQRLVCHRHIGLSAGTRNLGSLQSGPGLIVNQTLPRSTAISQLRINGTAAHLPGGLVQQGCKCHGSLRVVSNWSHFWSAQHIRMCFGEPSQVPLWACYWYGKPGQPCNQRVNYNPLKVVGTVQRCKPVGSQKARAVGASIPLSLK